eukprot:COSAG06_NODE_3242_length_5628_cov_1.674806_6_plen_111_part_00
MNVPPQSAPAGALRLTWHVRAFVSSSRVAARPRLDKALAQQARVEPRRVPGQVVPRRMAAGCRALWPLVYCSHEKVRFARRFSFSCKNAACRLPIAFSLSMNNEMAIVPS